MSRTQQEVHDAPQHTAAKNTQKQNTRYGNGDAERQTRK